MSGQYTDARKLVLEYRARLDLQTVPTGFTPLSTAIAFRCFHEPSNIMAQHLAKIRKLPPKDLCCSQCRKPAAVYCQRCSSNLRCWECDFMTHIATVCSVLRLSASVLIRFFLVSRTITPCFPLTSTCALESVSLP
jgi:hypothetical protein